MRLHFCNRIARACFETHARHETRGKLLSFCLMMAVASTAPALGQNAPGVRMPPGIGEAYGRLGKSIMAHDADGVRTVWAEDFVVNAPNNSVLRREEVVAKMKEDFLSYRNFEKHVTCVEQKPEVTVVMGYDTMVPVRGPGAGRTVVRPFTDIWAKRATGWQLIARQATIAAVD